MNHHANEHLDESFIQSCFLGELSDELETRAQCHLDQCDVCRAKFDSIAGSPDDWQRISSALRIEQQAFRSGCSQCGEQNVVPYFPGEYAEAPIEFAISFLEPSDRDDALGRLGEFEIHNVIGFGGMGIVLKGFQEELNRPVAVKVMAPHLATSGAARQRFLREAQATAAIVHPNVMPILSVSEKSTLPFLVMPYIACHSLQQRLDAEGTLPIVEVLRIALQVAEGLAAAHSHGLVHRDVKPANILLERGVDRALLTDFGLARAVDDATLTRSGVIAGTPQYMSPEQARGEPVDARSDLFSLGSVIYAMCVGHPPFRAETSYGILRKVTDSEPKSMQQSNAEVPSWLERLVEILMAKDRESRCPDATHAASLLRQCLAQVQNPMTQSVPKELRDALEQPKLRGRHWITPLLVALVSLVTLPSIVGIYGWVRIQEQRELTRQIETEISHSFNARTSRENTPELPTMTQDEIRAEIDEISAGVDRLMQSLEESASNSAEVTQ